MAEILATPDIWMRPDVVARLREEMPAEQAVELVDAIHGKPNRLADHFVSGITRGQPHVLASRIRSDGRDALAWLIASESPQGSHVRGMFESAGGAARDELLTFDAQPPAVIFVEALAVSHATTATDSDDPAVFRVHARTGAIADVDRQLVLSRPRLEAGLREGTLQLEELGLDAGVASGLRERAAFFAMLHAEGHNRGHFAGPRPMGPAKHVGPLYEAIEELRACLAAVRWGRHLEISEDDRDALALTVLANRLRFGRRSFGRTVRTRQSIREVAVAGLLIEGLVRRGAIRRRSDRWVLGPPREVRDAMEDDLRDLHGEEAAVNDPDDLRDIARSRLSVAFPNAQLPQASLDLLATTLAPTPTIQRKDPPP